ncbi:MAG TPA: DUF4203 domain-containing protein [Actinomycetota bacterium]|jgi:hypothetical protein|nr:DUF4203 domain-containing protein [Actinomycetota bacterium]
MTTDGTFAAIIAASFLLFLSAIVAFFGTRLFWIILPIWGFFFGLAIGAQGVQALFGDGFLSTAFSWIVAFFLGLLFALLSYLFWFVAVALIGGYLGYGIVVGFFGLIGVELGVFVWLLGVAVGIICAVLTIRFNVQRWVVVIGTSLLGAAGIVGTFLVLFDQLTPQQMADHPVKVVTDAGFGYAVLVIVIAALGIAFQAASTRTWEVSRYNRWTEYTTAPSTDAS